MFQPSAVRYGLRPVWIRRSRTAYTLANADTRFAEGWTSPFFLWPGEQPLEARWRAASPSWPCIIRSAGARLDPLPESLASVSDARSAEGSIRMRRSRSGGRLRRA